MRITKAIIPAGGFGTRMLPATKAIPKELLPLVDKPAIQYNVEEAVKSGITDICIIVGPGKAAIEDHFSTNERLEERLLKGGKKDEKLLESIKKISRQAKITYVLQEDALGLGHAISLTKDFVNDEPFVILYGDDVIIGENPCCKQICDAFEKYQKSVVAIKEVTDEFIVKYSSMKCKSIEKNIYAIDDMIEKPTLETKFSNYSILGRCALTPDIFDILEKIDRGAGGEYQLTDAMAIVARSVGMIGVDFEGTRYDMGNKFEMLKASIEVGLTHSEIKDQLIPYIKELAKKI